MNPRFDRLIPYFRFPDLLAGDKYKPNEEGAEFVGLKNAKMIWQTLTGVGDSVGGAGTSGLMLDRFNTTRRADAALIRLVNNSGSTKTIRGCVIRGKPVIRYSGDQGYTHDELIAYNDILDNGEKKFEFGNNYIEGLEHLKKLADLYWKTNRAKRHVYQVELSGRCHWYSPGEWYTLVAVSKSENINAVCECVSVKIEGRRDTAGRTVLTLREVYREWVYNINAGGSFTGYGPIKEIFSHNKIKIASSAYTMAADVYCDGVADQVEINNAINALAGMGGGIVELTEGTFKTNAAIVPANNIAIVGQGWNTVIEKNGNFVGIALAGSAGNEYQNILLEKFKITRNAADTNAQHLIHFQYCDKIIINGVWAYDSYNVGIQLFECEDFLITGCYVSGCDVGILTYATAVGQTISGRIIGNHCAQNLRGQGIGIAIRKGAYCSIVGNITPGNYGYGIHVYDSKKNSIEGNVAYGNAIGIFLDEFSSNNVISGNIAENNTTYGIRINSMFCDRNVVTGNRATGNGTNFSDLGTNTTNSGNDFV